MGRRRYVVATVGRDDATTTRAADLGGPLDRRTVLRAGHAGPVHRPRAVGRGPRHDAAGMREAVGGADGVAQDDGPSGMRDRPLGKLRDGRGSVDDAGRAEGRVAEERQKVRRPDDTPSQQRARGPPQPSVVAPPPVRVTASRACIGALLVCTLLQYNI